MFLDLRTLLPTFFLLPIWLALQSPLFPYTTLLRSHLTDVLEHQYDNPLTNKNDATITHELDEYLSIHGVNPVVLQNSETLDRKSTRLNSSHVAISYAVFCLKKII